MPAKLNVLFLAAEAEPFIKVGGLGDVAGSLPLFLRAHHSDQSGEADVRLVIPLHAVVKSERGPFRPLTVFSVPHRTGSIPVQAFVTDLDGMPVYLLDAKPISSGGSVYSGDPALDGEKYTFFPIAALELARRLEWDVDIVHANDWHTALACYGVMLRRRDGSLPGVASVLTVHNLPFMGPDLGDGLGSYGFEETRTGLPAWAATKPLALGLWSADAIVAVSPQYAADIQTRKFGAGLDEYLRARRDSIHGILNGIDTEAFNPATDAALASNYGVPTLERRALNKAALQMRLGLQENVDIPLFAVVSRLELQKGSDLLSAAFRRLSDVEWQAVVLGTGDARLEDAVQKLESTFPDRFRAAIRYDAGLARQIYAGADMLLMPSRYEPCGLAQMIAMRYGCIPIVTAVGGLRDTVVAGRNGFLMGTPTSGRLATSMREAMALRADKEAWSKMQVAAMSEDFSWHQSARKYLELYRQVLGSVRSVATSQVV